ncbi:MAG: tRNA-dihydrouridine synthase [Patescibacteria group bacterium]
MNEKINMGFWGRLPKPIFALAPMADVTDCVFRRLIAESGKPAVMFTEFVSADGLMSQGRKNLLVDLRFSEVERPVVAQLFSGNPEKMEGASRLAAELGFDGIDINMGCPDRSIEKSGAGAALIKDPKLAKEIIRAAKRGTPNLPISIKTRIGYKKNEIETWIPTLLEEGLAALTIHLRTRAEMSDVPAHWEFMPGIVALRDKISPQTLILGNGDVENLEDARGKIAMSGTDGAMLGRAIFGNPWLFAERDPSISEKLLMLIEHARRYEKELLPHKNFAIMKKHFKAYVNGFDGAKELRTRLMEASDAKAVSLEIDRFLETLKV